MTTTDASREPGTLPANASLADLIAFIGGNRGLGPRRRGDMASAIRTLAKAMGLAPEQAPADLRSINVKLKGFVPAQAGLSRSRWSNTRSLVRGAFRHAGIASMPGRYQAPLPPAWHELLQMLATPQERFRLSRFARHCSAQGIMPLAVDDQVFAAFLTALESGGLQDDPRQVHRRACKQWNQGAAAISSWPQQAVGVPSYTNTYAVPWSRFPETLKQDADRWLERLAGKDLLDENDFRPLRPSSLATRSRQLHELASAAVQGGIDPACLTSLADLVRLDVVRAALAFLLERHGGKPSVQTGQIAHLAVIIAVHWAEASEANVTQLKKWRRKMTPSTTGLSDKNRACLRQFDDQAKLAAILLLPQRLIAEAKRSKTITPGTALLVQTAVMVEILTRVPIRLQNLGSLTIGKHLIQSLTRKGVMHLTIPAHEVKNRTPIEAMLPEEACRLITLYIEKYRPLLCKDGSSALFPGRYAGEKSPEAIRDQISNSILDRTGIAMTPHQFRHLLAKHYLDEHPGAYGTIRDVLGHKSINTTTLYYCGTETAAAFRHVDEHIMKKRADKRLIVRAAKVGRHG